MENSLDANEIKTKSLLLNESFHEDAEKALKMLKDRILSLRSLDYLNQTEIFLNLLNIRLINDFKKINYLLADDIDELSYSAQSFIKTLIPNLKEFYFAADPQGGARRGYLCAYPEGWEEIKRYYKSETVNLNKDKPIYNDAIELFNAIKHNSRAGFSRIILTDEVKRTQMLDNTLDTIEELLQDNKPEDIKIITPIIDENIKCAFTEFFDRKNINYQFLSGSKKLIDDPFVHGSFIIAQLINKQWKLTPTQYEIRILLTSLFGFPVSICQEILEKYKNGELSKDIKLGIAEFDGKYQHLISSINDIKEKNQKLQDQLIEIFIRIISPIINEATNLEDFNRILKSLNDFMVLIDKFSADQKPVNPEKEWLIQIKNTVVSDNPPSAPEIKQNSIIIATPQRIIDLELESKYQIWLDVSSSLWTKDDTGPLYNAWVFQKNWQGDKYTPETHKKLTLNKAAHVLRKLVLCANEKIFAFSSSLDNAGNDNTGYLHLYLSPLDKSSFDFKEIIPRDDQKPVLEYKGGKMAVPAVPGSGKTTIMRELIIKLIKDGVEPESILVLTYMGISSKNFSGKD